MTASTDRLKQGRIGVAALIVGGGILVSRLLGVIREVIFAGMLGANAATDQYVAAFRIPDFANYLLAGGFLTITFIPIFSRYLADDEESEGWRGFTAIVRWLAIGITALIVAGWFATPAIVDRIYPDFTDSQVATTVRLTRIVLPAQFAFVVGAMFAAVQFAKGVFAIPALAPVVYNLGIIIGGISYALIQDEPDPEGFIWGAVVGAFVGNLFLQWYGARRVGMRRQPHVSWVHPAVKQYVLIAIPLMIGQSIVALDEAFMSIFGQTVGDGEQTHLLYARRTMLVPIGVIAQAASVAAYPFMARLFAEGKIKELNRTVDRSLRWVVGLSIGAAALLAALSVPVIRTLFERGEFDEANSAAAASALFFYAFAIPIWGALQIITRAFYARRNMWTPVIIGTVATVIAIPVYVVLADSFGLEGVAVASVLTLGGYTAALVITWYSGKAGRSRLVRVLENAGRAVPLAVLGAIAAFLTAWLVYANLPGPTTIVNSLAVLAGTLVFLIVALLLGSLLHDHLHKATVEEDPPPPGEDETLDMMDVLG
jgi:putative peptidoglycan lipid II flippase